MRIESTELAMQASYFSQTRTESQQRLSTWSNGARGSGGSGNAAQGGFSLNSATRVSLSEAARMSLQIETSGSSNAAGAVEGSDDAVDNDPMMALMRSMVEMFTGQALKVFSSSDMPPVRQTPNLSAPGAQGTSAAPRSASGGQALAYDEYYLREEIEQMSFSAEGVIKTSDGQEIRFTLELQMERTYREESSLSVRMGEAAKTDPLVVNFGGTAAQLNNRFIEFDLDSNGLIDLLPELTRGSAYLVLDRNENGKIDNGRELFGPATNKGFAELALLDADGNAWIDEADPLFSRLSLWNPSDNDSGGSLRSLAEAGIGAISLSNVRSDFALRGSANEDLGRVRDTGLYLNNNGTAGTLQEIDLTVR